jgi:hypothetical protein
MCQTRDANEAPGRCDDDADHKPAEAALPGIEDIERSGQEVLDTTLGGLVHQAKDLLPNNLSSELAEVIKERNYLVHHFLREYFMAQRSVQNRDQAKEYLLGVSSQLGELSNQLDAYLESLGLATPDTLEPELQAQINLLRPKEWPLES